MPRKEDYSIVLTTKTGDKHRFNKSFACYDDYTQWILEVTAPNSLFIDVGQSIVRTSEIESFKVIERIAWAGTET